MKLNPLILMLLAGAALWIAQLQRRLESAQRRGDMYRDISARLDRRIAELTSRS